MRSSPGETLVTDVEDLKIITRVLILTNVKRSTARRHLTSQSHPANLTLPLLMKTLVSPDTLLHRDFSTKAPIEADRCPRGGRWRSGFAEQRGGRAGGAALEL